MKIKQTAISALKLAQYNPRKISDFELDNLKKSIKKFGFVQPVIANKNNTVIGGHQRIRAFIEMHKVCRPGAVIYVCTGWQSFSTFVQELIESGFHISETIIWVKNIAGIRTMDFPHKHEQIIRAKRIPKKKKKGTAMIYGWKKGKHSFYGNRSDYDVWEQDRLMRDEYLHPTEKPDWLVMKALSNSSKFKDKVLDLFGGAGPTLIACEKMDRQAFIMEMDPRFADVIIYKWERLTSKKATYEENHNKRHPVKN